MTWVLLLMGQSAAAGTLPARTVEDAFVYSGLSAGHWPSLVVAVLAGICIGVAGVVAVIRRGRRARQVAVRRLLDQWREDRRRIAQMLRFDSQTRLPNRRHLTARFPRLIAAARKDSSRLALIYLDLDHFKHVNAVHGHRRGDRLLSQIARRLRSCVSADDLVVRMNGDEFVVVATGLPAVSAGDYIAARIQEAVGVPIRVGSASLHVTVSMGIAMYPDDGADLATLLRHAEIALHQAKLRGRATHQFFGQAMRADLGERVMIEQSLRESLGTERFHIEYQPAFDLRTERPVGLEALLRWTHPELGAVSPARFVPIAEQSGLIADLGTWVLRRVCRQIAEWQRSGVPLLPVSINISAPQFARGRLAESVAALTSEFGVDPRLLHFELTESVLMHNSAAHLAELQALRALGSRVLIDDFGTGYSSLSYLKHLPIDALKIDRAFVRDMGQDARDAAIVSTIVGLARSLGLEVIAEGVETPEQVACLRKLGCDAAQGFHFSRPLAPEPCAHLVRQMLPEPRPAGPARLRSLS